MEVITEKKMRISILIPAHNEELSIAACIQSCLNQSRMPDEIIVVNDGSTDRTGEILAAFKEDITNVYGNLISVVTIPVATGSKSYAQEYGLKFITGDIFIATDGDTVLHHDFVKYVEEDFRDESVSAIAGYVRSMKYNWLTACRAVEYVIGQNIHKLAQHHINFLFVISGAAGAFRTRDFLRYVHFGHDTLTEDLDCTYSFHEQGLKILYDKRVVAFTQDPVNIHSYINQIRRWFGGGWQCLIKHRKLVFSEPRAAFEISLMYGENIAFSILLFLLPFLSLSYFAFFIFMYLAVWHILAVFAAWKEKRPELILVPISYLFLTYINAYIFLEQMVRVVFLRQNKLAWFHPKRVSIPNSLHI